MVGREFDYYSESFDLKQTKRELSVGPLSIEEDFSLFKCGSSSDGRASAFQAEGRGFDPRFPLQCNRNIFFLAEFYRYSASLSLSLAGFSLPR